MSLFRILHSLTGRRRPQPARFDAPLRPDETFYAIGDIHGHTSALQTILAAIDQADPNPTIICVGDFIDRGEHSADVLRQLYDLSRRRGPQFVCLMGNHEELCLGFLDDPEKHGKRWLQFGGLQTLASFGIGLNGAGNLVATRDALALAMGADLIAWLRDLPTFWISGNIAVSHAGADPHHPISDQPRRHLLWGHPDFGHVPRSDGMWVLHGHTIVDQPRIENGRISIDTGAYATGHLTGAQVSTQGVEFVTT